MNDREFIELLNLYVDKEISQEDALRLEAEVAANPERRKVYDQYCRIQRACCQLAEQMTESAAERPESLEDALRAPFAWRMAPYIAGLAAAACVAVFVGLRDRGPGAVKASQPVAVDSAASHPAPDVAGLSHSPEPMTAVFSTRIAAGQPDRTGARALFAVDDASSQMPQLNWIEDIHMTPVPSAADSAFLLTQKPDLRAPISTGPQNSRDSQQPAELTAFRFQR